ncbi:MAG: DUF533 domain-containing protein [Pseudomonadota bacterium]
MNPQALLDQFVGTGAGQGLNDAMAAGKGKLQNSGIGGIAGGLAAGGVLGLLMGNKKMRKQAGKLAGGVVGYGGAAALGALAFRAYSKWQDGKAPANGPGTNGSGTIGQGTHRPEALAPGTVGAAPISAPQQASVPQHELPHGSKFLPETAPSRDGSPFEITLIKSMIAAANADGHIDSGEQKLIFEKVAAFPLDAEDKALIFDTLANPPSLQQVADLAEGMEQSVEIYLVSRLAIDPDEPIERAYLEALASRLGLPSELVAHLENEAAASA